MPARRALLIVLTVILLAGSAGLSAAAVVPVRAWALSVDEGAATVILVEEGFAPDVDRILARLRGTPGVDLRVAPAGDLVSMANDLAPALVVGGRWLEDELDLMSQAGPRSFLLHVSLEYRVEARALQPWLLLSPFPGGSSGDVNLDLARAVLAGESMMEGHEVVPRDRILAESGGGSIVAPARPADRRVDLQPWAVNGVLPDLRSWTEGAYSLGRDVVVLARNRRVDGLLSSFSHVLLPAARDPSGLAAMLSDDEARTLWWGDVPEVRLSAVGDISFARRIERRIDELGLGYPLRKVACRLSWADVVVANLESPMGVTGTPIPNKMIWFRARPETVMALVDAGIDIVSLANNHSMDYDVENFLETLDILEEAGVLYIGGGRDIEQARTPLVMDRGGVRVAFLAYNAFAHIFWSHEYPLTFEAGPGSPGTAPLRDEVFDWIEEDIRRARTVADVVVVYHHWGREYRNHPDSNQVRWGRRTVEAGADLVLGSHPHAIQGIEIYQGKPIVYSMGNFVFDQNKPITTESMIVELVLTPDGVRAFNVVPVRLVDDQPRVLDGDEADELMSKFRQLSRDLEGGGG